MTSAIFVIVYYWGVSESVSVRQSWYEFSLHCYKCDVKYGLSQELWDRINSHAQ